LERLEKNKKLIHCSNSLLLGNPAKAERVLGWRRKVDFDSLVKEMVEMDLKAAKSLIEDQN
jgi:GDPmannose 4,6-dehydratase